VALVAATAAAAVFGTLSLAGAPLLAPVRVESAPARASVFVDNVFRGVTPVTIDDLAPGAHALRIEKADFEPFFAVLGAAAPAMPVRLRPSPGGELVVRSKPAGAEVFVDGHRSGVTPFRLAGIRVGAHVLRVEKADHVPWSGTVLVRNGEAREVSCELADRMLEYLRTAAEAYPEEIYRYMELGHYLFMSGLAEEAVEAYRRGIEIAEIEYALAQLPSVDRDYLQEVKEKHSRIRKRMEGDRRSTGAASASFRTKMDEAQREILSRFPNSVNVSMRQAALRERGGQLDAAAEVIEKAVGEVPRNPVLWETLARLRLGLGDFPGAAEALGKAIDLSPGDAHTAMRMAGELLAARRESNEAGAAEVFGVCADELVRIRPSARRDQQPRLDALMYGILRRAGRVGGAMRALDDALGEEPDPEKRAALGQESRGWLEDLAQSSPEPALREAARGVLDRLDELKPGD